MLPPAVVTITLGNDVWYSREPKEVEAIRPEERLTWTLEELVDGVGAYAARNGIRWERPALTPLEPPAAEG